MDRAGEMYQRHINKQTGKFATWPLGSRVELGDVGILRGGEFRVETNLGKLGIPFGKREAAITDESHSSVRWSSVDADTELQLPGPRAVAKLEFSNSGSVVFEAHALQQVLIDDFHTVAKHIRQLDDWQRSWVIIDQIWRSSQVAIIVALSDGASAHVVADGAGTLQDLSALADASLGFRIERASGQLSVVKSGGLVHPLFTCRKRNVWGKVVAVSTHGDDEQAADAEWPTCEFDDLLGSWIDAD